MLGVIGAAAFVTEGAVADWAGVHAVRVLGADPSTGSLLYAVFFVAMTVIRFVGDAVRARLGAVVTIRLAGGVTTAGYVLVLLAGAAPESVRVGTAMVGWALAGAGMAVVWPVITSELGAAGGSVEPAVHGHDDQLWRRFGRPCRHRLRGGHGDFPVGLLIPAALAVVVAAVAPLILRRVSHPDGDVVTSGDDRPRLLSEPGTTRRRIS